MNEIHHRKITIEMDIWECFTKISDSEIDDLLSLVKTKKLLAHCGNIHIRMEQ